MWGLQWTENKEIPSFVGLDGSNITDMIVTAMREQTRIGWKNLRRGFISQTWAKLQYAVDNNQRREPKDWNKLLVKWVMDVSWEMWLHRNTALHGNNHKEGKQIKLDNLKRLVDILYQRADKVKCVEDKDVQAVFKLHKEKRKKKGVIALETWVNLAEKVTEKAEKELADIQRNGLDKWLNRELTYQVTH